MQCVKIEGDLPIKSHLVRIWGLEPIRLSAVIALADAVPDVINYKGLYYDGSLHVVSYRQVDQTEGAKVYAIEAATDPIFWTSIRVTVKYDDPILGVPVSFLADAVAEKTGWSIEGLPEYKVPYLIFTGNVVEALRTLERMTGRLVELDHEAKTIRFTDKLPIRSAIPEGTIIERGSSVSTQTSVICYGTLLHKPADNFSIADEFQLPEYKTIEVSIPADSWDVSVPSAPKVIKRVSTTEFFETETTEQTYAGADTVTTARAIAHVEKGLAITFIASTQALKQDEVLLSNADGVPGVKVKFADPNILHITHEGQLGNTANVPPQRVIVTNSMDEAKKLVMDYQQMYASGDELGYYIILAPGTEGSATTSLGYFFGYTVFIVGKIFFKLLEYRTEIKQTFINGVLVETEESTPSTEDLTPMIDLALVGIVLREDLFKHLVFEIELDGIRVKFPYAVDELGNAQRLIEEEEIRSDTVYIQNNDAAHIEAAASYAKLQAELLKSTEYVGILDADDVAGATKLVEDFTSGGCRRIAYFRLKGDEM